MSIGNKPMNIISKSIIMNIELIFFGGMMTSDGQRNFSFLIIIDKYAGEEFDFEVNKSIAILNRID